MLTSMLQRCIFRSALEEIGCWSSGRHSELLSGRGSVASVEPTAVPATQSIWSPGCTLGVELFLETPYCLRRPRAQEGREDEHSYRPTNLYE